ncbi:MAG: signal peptide peptidase SppA [Eubacteriales bacterium]
MNKKLVIGIIAGVVIVSLAVALATNPTKQNRSKAGDRIGVIYVEGVISGSRSESGFLGTGSGGQSVMEQLKKAREDDSIKAVLLRINSPGGSAAASQEIGDEIERVRKAGKTVVASMGDVAASGGYWIAAKADKIMANPATMTGSIGVIMESMNIQELYNKIGVSPQTVKSGPFKDIGSPNRPISPAERAILQGMVDDIYQQFVDVVAKGRKMDRNEVLKLADGRIFTGRQAKNLGLVDALGNYYDAIELTRKVAKISGEPVIYEFGPKTPFEMFFGGINSLLGNNYSPGLEGLSPREIQMFREMLKFQPTIQNR